jgi:predicted ATPase
MIKQFKVKDLNDKGDVTLVFNRDLNILTGKNGSGKTTLLKLLWYCYSGNIDRIRNEIVFREAHLETSSFSLRVSVDRSSEKKSISYDFTSATRKIAYPPPRAAEETLISTVLLMRPDSTDDIRGAISELNDSSVFFPTFRRIEGGYAFDRRRRNNRYLSNSTPALQQAISEFSETLENGKHHFVASVATDDIVSLLTSKYAEISQKTNRLHVLLSETITKTIKTYEQEHRVDSDAQKLQSAQDTLTKIREQISLVEHERAELFKSFIVLGQLIRRILQHKGIRVTDAITFGEAEESMDSDKLSAGEKQMLSFLCYNAFSESCVIFIDEPEISLNVDWQRTLFPTLLDQSTTNQFIVATHSPFIYSKYADKELIVNPDRGT